MSSSTERNERKIKVKRKYYSIDASLFTSKEEVHNVLKKIFEGSEYYGSNLDALHDVLTSVCRDVKISVRGLDAARPFIGDYADGIKKVFEDSAAENGHIKLRIK